MDQKLNDEYLVRRYLLGELAEQEREELERRLLVDLDYSALVSALEEDLIEDYVSSRLGAEEARKFENVFLRTPEGVEQVRLARNLRTYSLKQDSGDAPKPLLPPIVAEPKSISLMDYLRSKTLIARIAMTGAAIAVLAGPSFMFIIWQLQDKSTHPQPPNSRIHELEEQLAKQQALNDELVKSLQQERDEREKLEQELADSRQTDRSQLSPKVATFLLSPGRVREGRRTNELRINPGISLVSFRLSIRKTSYKSFRVSIQTEGGGRVWSGAAQPSSSGGEVRFSVPANLLPDGRYVIQLQPADQAESEFTASYYFTVIKR